MRIRAGMARTSRVVVVSYNPYLALLYRLTTWLGLRAAEPNMTFVTLTDLRNLARLSGLEIVRVRPCVAFPWRLLGIGSAINALLSILPFFGWRALVHVITLRPVGVDGERPSLSVVIPARNERGNIEEALRRMPDSAHAHRDHLRRRWFERRDVGRDPARRRGVARSVRDQDSAADGQGEERRRAHGVRACHRRSADDPRC